MSSRTWTCEFGQGAHKLRRDAIIKNVSEAVSEQGLPGTFQHDAKLL